MNLLVQELILRPSTRVSIILGMDFGLYGLSSGFFSDQLRNGLRFIKSRGTNCARAGLAIAKHMLAVGELLKRVVNRTLSTSVARDVRSRAQKPDETLVGGKETKLSPVAVWPAPEKDLSGFR